MQSKEGIYIKSFKRFIKTINGKILELIDSNNGQLTNDIKKIHKELWDGYKKISGTSAGTYWISEYIVFSVFSQYITKCNTTSKEIFEFKPDNVTDDLRYFKAERNNKSILIFRSSNLKSINKKTEGAIFNEKMKNRSPDIVIIKKDNNSYELISVIEIKNYLDKSAVNSGIKILEDVKESVKSNIGKNTKYVLFSYSEVKCGDNEIKKELNTFEKNKFLCSLENGNKYNIRDLSKVLKKIKEEVTL